MALTSEEESGPYEYLLAVVKTVHFKENLPFYTVTRMDSGEDQRADIGEFCWMLEEGHIRLEVCDMKIDLHNILL